MIELLVEAERALSMGRLDRADELYHQIAAADPRNAMAVVGLARLSLERGDDLGAYLQARRALKIDPENDAARRLAIRIEEVMRTRGDEVPDVGPMPAAVVEPPAAIAGAPTAVKAPAPEPAPPTSDTADASPRRSLIDRLRGR